MNLYRHTNWKLVNVHGIRNGICTCSNGAECRTPGKHPVKSKWTLAAYDANMPGNLGVRTGSESGIWVLDVDGDKGRRSLDQLQAEYGALPGGPRQVTGSGGLHIVFKWTPGLKNLVQKLPGLDIRTDGGMIVAEPSEHVSGGMYRWTDLHETVPEAPQWLIDVLRDRIPSQSFESWLSTQPPCVQGENGSVIMMRIAAAAVRKFKIRDTNDFVQRVSTYNARCVPPWTFRELEHKHQSALESAPEAVALNEDTPLDLLLVEIISRDYDLAYDSRRGKKLLAGEYVTDEHVANIKVDLMRKYKNIKRLPLTLVHETVDHVATKNKFDPVRKYLDELRWDGIARVVELVSADLKPIERVYIRKWLIGAVARTYVPGCDMQNVLIFKGGQGVGKSSFFKALGGPWFTDNNIDLDSGDVTLRLRDYWIIEYGELDSLWRGKEVNRVKSFLSTSVDTYREKYARNSIEVPRRCVFAGSTNESDFLVDATGDRRFWVVETEGMIDWRKVKDTRDQIWAEAVHMYRAGQDWHLTAEENKMRAEQNEHFQEEDPVLEAVQDHVEGKKEVHVRALCDSIHLDASEMKNVKRVGRCLTRLGWHKRRINTKGKRSVVWYKETQGSTVN